MDNNENLSNILENELSNIFNNILNYIDSPHDLPRNNEEYSQDQQIIDIHTLQLNTLNNFINQYFSQLNMFQENTRELIQTLRSTIHQQNVVYSHVLRRNNTRQTPVFSNPNVRNTARAWNNPNYNFTNLAYEIPHIYIPRRPHQTNRLTQEQINNSVQHVEYNEEMTEDRCPITLENFVVGENICQIRHCGHIFKSTGLMQWFQRNVKCPVCRYDLRTYQPTDTMQGSSEVEPNSQPTQDSSRNLVNTRNIIYNRINNIMQQLQNHLPDNDVPTVYTIDIPIYIDDLSYNRLRN